MESTAAEKCKIMYDFVRRIYMIFDPGRIYVIFDQGESMNNANHSCTHLPFYFICKFVCRILLGPTNLPYPFSGFHTLLRVYRTTLAAPLALFFTPPPPPHGLDDEIRACGGLVHLSRGLGRN